jgi:hypothetical protein
MTRAERRAVLVLGAGQLVNWGVLYYAFGALLLPLERALGTSRTVVAGAFSAALLVAAAAAPSVGRRLDRGRGAFVLQAGSVALVFCLLVWPLLPGLLGLYVVWLALGLSMAATLYEPAFAIVGRHFEYYADRLRAVAAVTLLGGLASTVFVPLTTWLVLRFGWTGASWSLAALVAVATAAVGRWALPAFAEAAPLHDAAAAQGVQHGSRDDGARVSVALILVYGATSLAATALVTSLVPALVDRGYTATGAAWVAGLIGVMQLPGRTLIFSGRLASHPSILLVGSLVLQGLGLATVAAVRAPALVSLAVTAFALGAGVNTLVRPQLVHVMYGASRAGYVNGVLARTQNLARAAGPLFAASLQMAGGYGLVFGASAASLAALAWHWWLTRARYL